MIPKLIIHPEINIREDYASKMIAELGFSQNHPDLMWLGESEKLGMEQAKNIKNFLNLKPYQAKGQIIVIIAGENLTGDAQNALLKTLEEHPLDVNLILGASNEEQLLPTLISRCQIVKLPNDTEVNQKELEKFYKQIETLLTSTTEDRFKFIEKLEDKDLFLIALTHYFREKIHKESAPKSSVNYLKDLVQAGKWAKANVNIRAILEYLMLCMPKK